MVKNCKRLTVTIFYVCCVNTLAISPLSDTTTINKIYTIEDTIFLHTIKLVKQFHPDNPSIEISIISESKIYNSKDYGRTWTLKCPNAPDSILKVYGSNLFGVEYQSGYDTAGHYYSDNIIQYSYLDGVNWENKFRLNTSLGSIISFFEILAMPPNYHVTEVFCEQFCRSSGDFTRIRNIGGKDMTIYLNSMDSPKYTCQYFKGADIVDSVFFIYSSKHIYKKQSNFLNCDTSRYIPVYEKIGLPLTELGAGVFQDGDINDIFTLNNKLLVATSGGLYATINYGDDFFRVDTTSLPGKFGQIDRMGGTLFTTNADGLWKSMDTGKTWVSSFSSDNFEVAIGVSTGYVLTKENVIYYSSDTGKTWISSDTKIAHRRKEKIGNECINFITIEKVSRNSIQFHLSPPMDISFKIFTLEGRSIANREVRANKGRDYIETFPPLCAGIYIYNCRVSGEVITGKVMIP